MGILNVTPDSFFESSRITTSQNLLHKAEDMVVNGAAILDVGGYSSRPGAEHISTKEETKRILKPLQELRKEFPDTLISLDTFRAEVAKVGLEEGVDIINDISAGNLDTELPILVAQYKVPYIIMHMKGTPQTMQNEAKYENIMHELIFYFSEKKKYFEALGIHDLILDPGFGFAKTVEDNFTIIQNFQLLTILNCPLLVGISRKSFIQKKLGVSIENALEGTSTLHMELLKKGANILRVHDVKEAKETIARFKF